MEKEKDFSNSEVTHIKKGRIEYLTFKALDKYADKIKCVVTLRRGGISEGVYSSLNFRLSGSDLESNVYNNLKSICDVLNIDNNKIYKGYQDHTNNVVNLTKENKEKFEFNKRCEERVDGYIVSEKSIGTLVTTADCNPIIIYDPVNNVYANIHSGWKGTIKKIYLKALEQMNERYNTQNSNVIICVGPAVQKCCFNSKELNFKKKFTDVWNCEEDYIDYENNETGRFHIDLNYVIKKGLLESGVKEENIHFANICTCCNDNYFFSYRSKTQKQEEDYGCMATIVELV